MNINNLSFFQRNHIFYKLSRFFSAKSNNYDLIYNFPYARVGSTVNKLKLYQTALSGVALPASAALEMIEVVPAGTLIACCYTCAVFNFSFYSVGQLFHRLIGKIYLSNDGKIARFSYIGFFGKRSELFVPLEDNLDVTVKSGPLYTNIYFPQVGKLKLQEKYCNYCNYNLIRAIFGEDFMRT